LLNKETIKVLIFKLKNGEMEKRALKRNYTSKKTTNKLRVYHY